MNEIEKVLEIYYPLKLSIFGPGHALSVMLLILVATSRLQSRVIFLGDLFTGGKMLFPLFGVCMCFGQCITNELGYR